MHHLHSDGSVWLGAFALCVGGLHPGKACQRDILDQIQSSFTFFMLWLQLLLLSVTPRVGTAQILAGRF